MKANLLICLGNPLMGDDGIGWHVADRLARGASVPENFDFQWGGTDLLRLGGEMEGRQRVILVDAIEDPSPVGSLLLFEDGFFALADGQKNAHQLSAVEAVRLLRLTSDRLKQVRFRLLGVAVASAGVGEELSPELRAQVPQIVEAVLEEMARG